jgi:hypothetical protein
MSAVGISQDARTESLWGEEPARHADRIDDHDRRFLEGAWW